jgi:hypothetical protein
MRQTIPAVLKIGKEVDALYNLDQLNFNKQFPVYRCAYLFPDEPFTDILFGSDVMNMPEANILLFDEGGLQFHEIAENDIFVRAGQLASCVKHHLGSIIHKKYTDSNTFSKTLKLGFRLQPGNKEKRVICYVRLLGCIESVQSALIETGINTKPSVITTNHPPDYESIDIHLKFQRINNLFHKLINMKSLLAKTRSEIRYFKYTRGCIDHINLEKQASDVDAKLEKLLEALEKI